MQQQTIQITGVESRQVNESQVITLLAGKDKFQFWSKKKDGSSTKAYEQFQKFRFNAGDSVEVAFESKPESFMGKQGKMIEFNRNTILYFAVQDDFTPKQPITPKMNENAPQVNLDPNTSITRDEYLKLIGRIKALEAIVFKQSPNIVDVEDDEVTLDDCPF
jgi:hypothetical protein